jgi:hypothetical protein
MIRSYRKFLAIFLAYFRFLYRPRDCSVEVIRTALD